MNDISVDVCHPLQVSIHSSASSGRNDIQSRTDILNTVFEKIEDVYEDLMELAQHQDLPPWTWSNSAADIHREDEDHYCIRHLIAHVPASNLLPQPLSQAAGSDLDKLGESVAELVERMLSSPSLFSLRESCETFEGKADMESTQDSNFRSDSRTAATSLTPLSSSTLRCTSDSRCRIPATPMPTPASSATLSSRRPVSHQRTKSVETGLSSYLKKPSKWRAPQLRGPLLSVPRSKREKTEIGLLEFLSENRVTPKGLLPKAQSNSTTPAAPPPLVTSLRNNKSDDDSEEISLREFLEYTGEHSPPAAAATGSSVADNAAVSNATTTNRQQLKHVDLLTASSGRKMRSWPLQGDQHEQQQGRQRIGQPQHNPGPQADDSTRRLPRQPCLVPNRATESTTAAAPQRHDRAPDTPASPQRARRIRIVSRNDVLRRRRGAHHRDPSSGSGAAASRSYPQASAPLLLLPLPNLRRAHSLPARLTSATREVKKERSKKRVVHSRAGSRALYDHHLLPHHHHHHHHHHLSRTWEEDDVDANNQHLAAHPEKDAVGDGAEAEEGEEEEARKRQRNHQQYFALLSEKLRRWQATLPDPQLPSPPLSLLPTRLRPQRAETRPNDTMVIKRFSTRGTRARQDSGLGAEMMLLQQQHQQKELGGGGGTAASSLLSSSSRSACSSRYSLPDSVWSVPCGAPPSEDLYLGITADSKRSHRQSVPAKALEVLGTEALEMGAAWPSSGKALEVLGAGAEAGGRARSSTVETVKVPVEKYWELVEMARLQHQNQGENEGAEQERTVTVAGPRYEDLGTKEPRQAMDELRSAELARLEAEAARKEAGLLGRARSIRRAASVRVRVPRGNDFRGALRTITTRK